MDTLASVFAILLFLGPGLAIKAYNNYINLSCNSKTNKQSIYEQLFSVVMHSTAVTSLTIGTANLLSTICEDIIWISSFSELIIRMDSIQYAITYLLLCTVICFVWNYFYKATLRGAIHDYRNRKLEKMNGAIIPDLDEKSVWENIVYNKCNDKEKEEKLLPVVSIYRNGDYITSGFLKSFNDSSYPDQELELVCTYEIDKILTKDKTRKDEDKILAYIEFEYYDINRDILIKFHDKEKLIEHWAEI